MKIPEQDWDDLREYKESLEHYGVPGMKWGVRKDRKTSRLRRGYSDDERVRRDKRAKAKVSRAKARAEKKQVKAREKAEKDAVKKEKKRQAILNNPTLLYKHRKEFSQAEIQAALKQFEWEKKLSDYSKERLKNGADYIDTMVKYSANAINLYNNAAKIMNAVNRDNEMKLPIVDSPSGSGGGDKKKKK